MISELKLAVNRSGEAPLSIPIYRKWWNHEMRRQKQQRERSREYFELAIHYNVWPMKYLGSYSHAMVITGRFRQKHQQKCQQITETIRLQTHLTISLLTISLLNPFFSNINLATIDLSTSEDGAAKGEASSVYRSGTIAVS